MMFIWGLQLILIIVLMLKPAEPLNDLHRKYFKCLVCQRVIEEMSKEIQTVSPSLKYNVGSYIVDVNANMKTAVEMRRSDVFLVELMERLCKKMGEYVRAYHKSSGQLEVIRLVINGVMNPVLHNYEIIKDGDLESLEFYCESIISDYEEELLSQFKGEFKDIKSKLCFGTEICTNTEMSSKSVVNDEL